MRLIFFVLFVGCLSGCAMVTSKNLTDQSEGISYYLPKRLHKVSVSVTNTEQVAGGHICNYQAKLTIEPQPLMPDSNYAFVANLQHNPFHSDEFKMTTTESGLLSSIDSKSTDNTGDIIGKIVQTLASFGVPIPGILPKAVEILPPTEKCKPIEVSAIVDLADPKDVKRLNDSLSVANIGLEVCGKGIKYAGVEHCVEQPKGRDDLQFDKQELIKIPESDGLFYRRELPYVVKLWILTDGKKAVVADALVTMPNLCQISSISFASAYFVTNTQKVGFNNGMLVSVETVRPSEALGFVSIPAEIVKNYMSIVTQVIKLKADYTNNLADQAKSEAALIDAIKSLKEKQNSLAKPTE